jgi:copper/silver efflux system protein
LAGVNYFFRQVQALEEGAVLRVRLKAMTVTVIGLLPITFGGGTGSKVMRRIAARMVGGMIMAPMLSMLVLPAAYLLIHRRGHAEDVDNE